VSAASTTAPAAPPEPAGAATLPVAAGEDAGQVAPPCAPHTKQGLSSLEAADRLLLEGPNELASAKPRNVMHLALGILREPMIFLLVACGVIYLFLGDTAEAVLLSTFVLVVIGITFYQERKVERALGALRDLSSPRATVIRDGARQRVAGRDVVRGDLVVLCEGERIPADAILVETANLTIDESLLTGESLPVRKQAASSPADARDDAGPVEENTRLVFSGSLVVSGQGIGQVSATGPATEIGKIGRALTHLEPGRTRLQREVDRIVRGLAIAGISFCVLVAVLYGLTRGDWLNGFLAGLTLEMAFLPEEFPVILTLFLALGAWRLSQRHVLTRRMPAVETLGSITTLCVDKTGTLTQNRMSVTRLDDGATTFAVDGRRCLPDDLHELVEFSLLASKRNPFDPMEVAFREFGEAELMGTEHLREGWEPVAEYPLADELLAMSCVHRAPGTEQLVVAAKGAPEAIADLCHFDERHWARLRPRLAAMAEDGLRVLGVARGCALQGQALPSNQHDFDFEFLGLVGLADPVRPGVREAVAECNRAGIRVVMITGDYAGTAASIAREIGLPTEGAILTGPEIDAMSDEELRGRMPAVSIFARTVPEQKLRLVQALRENDQVVGMTGDGVNDAPALKAASIGIAMGGRGTDVAREAAAIVLTDDDFTSIVSGVRLGRRIYDNLKKAAAYILSVHIPIAGMALIPVILGTPLVLMPVHIAFLQLIIDPTCAIVFEAERGEPRIMDRRPRPLGEPLFSRHMLVVSLLQGFVALLVVLGVYALSLAQGFSAEETRAITFTALVAGNVGLILTNLSWSTSILKVVRGRNIALMCMMAAATMLVAVLLAAPPARSLFGFAPLSVFDLFIAVGAGMLSVSWFEIMKLRRPFRRSRGAAA
jgi:Ca2+-transporting ATPase